MRKTENQVQVQDGFRLGGRNDIKIKSELDLTTVIANFAPDLSPLPSEGEDTGEGGGS